MTTPTVEQRLASLESSARRWRFGCIALACLIAAGVATGSAMAPRERVGRFGTLKVDNELLIGNPGSTQIKLSVERIPGQDEPVYEAKILLRGTDTRLSLEANNESAFMRQVADNRLAEWQTSHQNGATSSSLIIGGGREGRVGLRCSDDGTSLLLVHGAQAKSIRP